MTTKDALKIFGVGAAGTAALLAFLLLGTTEESFEFLVRLEDKTNAQVECLSPVHVEIVNFDDDTFKAACPVCESSDFLARTNDIITKKGHFITFKPAGWTWGFNERKHYGIVRIECTYEQAQYLCRGIIDSTAVADIKTYELAKNEVALKAAETTARLAARPRAVVFDYEKLLTVEQLAIWNDKDKEAEIIKVADLAEVE